MKKEIRPGYINNVATEEIVAALSLIKTNPTYLAEPFYRGTSERWDDNYLSFVDYHINHLRIHPNLDPKQYISNLRLRLRKNPN